MLKRLFDLTSSAAVLILFSPALLALALWIKFSDWGPIFFVQERMGLHNRPFNLLKFRSMTHDSEGTRRQVTSEGDNYITRPGRFLRKYKLDELPQLVNIFLGNMSVVGPRPEVRKYMDHYSDIDRGIVLSVKPGLTDYAAIEYRNESEELAVQDDPEQYYIDVVMPKKILLYKKYVEDNSFWLDLRLIFKTLSVVVFGR